MISVMNSVKTPINEVDKCLDSQLWHACAGNMVQLPPLNSKVFYFPQGHAEHAASGNVNFGDFPRIPPYILCQVSTIKFMADPDTDEVYAKIGLLPVRNPNDFDSDSDAILGFEKKIQNQNQENTSSFAKTLTQSDANNGGGFSVPRYCAETIFPKLDYTADPPVQNISAKDAQGQIWKFRHIYRGTPRRHLLTTGWSNFVNNKKLIAGDSIVFLRADNGDLCVGIRRAKRGIHENHVRNPNERFHGESVIEAVKLAVNGQPFEVFYYPRATAPEFFVKASTVIAAMRIQWCPGLRFKMPVETEDSSRISWYMGTVSSIHVIDPTRFPSSPWKLLQVTWDEPDLLQNTTRVNPWSIEVVSSMHLSPYSQPKKKPRIIQPPDFVHQPPLTATNHHLASIQGARHNNSQFAQNNNQHHLQFTNPQSFPLEKVEPLFPQNKKTDENISCLLTMGNGFTTKRKDDNDEKENSNNKRKPIFVLFGQPILTEQQLLENDVATNVSDVSVVLQNGPVETSSDEKSSRCRVVQNLANPSVNS